MRGGSKPALFFIEMSRPHVRDASAVAALDAVTHKNKAQGKTVETAGFNAPSGELDERGALAVLFPQDTTYATPSGDWWTMCPCRGN